jgi:hypothetical protein
MINLPAVSNLQRGGVCLLRDTLGLNVPIDDFDPSSRLLADLTGANMPRAQVAVKSDGLVGFTLNCEASMSQDSKNRSWNARTRRNALGFVDRGDQVRPSRRI